MARKLMHMDVLEKYWADSVKNWQKRLYLIVSIPNKIVLH